MRLADYADVVEPSTYSSTHNTKTKHKDTSMIKKTLFLLLVALQFAAVTPTAKADIEFPPCFPCDPK